MQTITIPMPNGVIDIEVGKALHVRAVSSIAYGYPLPHPRDPVVQHIDGRTVAVSQRLAGVYEVTSVTVDGDEVTVQLFGRGGIRLSLVDAEANRAYLQ
jgi:hypothetical protein